MDQHIISVTIPEACRLTGLGRSTIYEQLAAGNIEARKAGRRTLVVAQSLRDYITTLPTAYPAT